MSTFIIAFFYESSGDMALNVLSFETFLQAELHSRTSSSALNLYHSLG